MQFAPLEKKDRAAFREMLVPADGSKLCSAALLFALSVLAIPFSHIEAVAGLYLIYAAVFYYALTRSLGSLLILAAPGAFLYGLSGLIAAVPNAYMLPAVYAALILGPVSGGFLVAQCREKRFLPLLLIPVGAFLLAAFFLSPWRALFVLLPVALALVLGHALLTCTAQTTTLLRMATVLAIGATGAYLIWFFLQGAPGGDPFTLLTALLHRFIGELIALYEQAAAAQGMTLALTKTDVFNVGALLGNVLPGTFLALCAILSFGIFRTFLRVLVGWGTLKRVPLRLGALTVSALCAALFILCFLSSLIAGATLFGTVCENLVIILQPALLLVGISALLVKEGGRRSTLSTLLLIGLLLLLWTSPSFAFSAAALLGAVRVLMAAALTRRKKDGT